MPLSEQQVRERDRREREKVHQASQAKTPRVDDLVERELIRRGVENALKAAARLLRAANRIVGDESMHVEVNPGGVEHDGDLTPLLNLSLRRRGDDGGWTYDNYTWFPVGVPLSQMMVEAKWLLRELKADMAKREAA